MRIVRPVQRVIDAFEALPGIGPKSAGRLAYYLLNVPQERLEKFAESVARIKKDTVLCELCFNVGEEKLCQICDDVNRNHTQACVVETALDLIAIEKADSYKGVYHVLGGVISPLNGIGPSEVRIKELLARVKTGEVREVIMATNPTMEGEATAMYIREKVREIDGSVSVTRIGRGLPTGADIEYADGHTLMRALEGRGEF